MAGLLCAALTTLSPCGTLCYPVRVTSRSHLIYPLHVPHVRAVVIEGDQPVFTHLQRSPETRGRNGRGGTAAFDVLRMEISQVWVMEDRPKRQQVRVGIQDEGAIDAREGLENRGRQIHNALVAQQIVKLILRRMPGCR